MARLQIKEREKRHGTARFFGICLLTAAMLSALAVLSAREIFALNERGRSGEAAEITLSVPTDTKGAARLLKENGLIGNETLFRLYSALRGKNAVFQPGRYTLSPSAGYDGLIYRLMGGGSRKREQTSVTVPEGSTVSDIIRLICREKRICSENELTDVIQNGDFRKYGFVRELDGAEGAADRIYRLEGYLYPDTYYFYTDQSAYAVVDRMLDNFEKHFDEKYQKACKRRGLTVNDAVILASMITKEAKNISDYPKVSSVFNNRKNSSSFGGLYQSDATLTYALGRPMEGGDKTALTPYNTYKYAGLPPSAICNPDMNALSYAICPDRTPYYYFVSDKNGDMHYATTYDQHRRNVNAAAKA